MKGGRCEACKGDGTITIEMHFLPDVYVPCEVCGGKRYNRETLEVRYGGRTIHEVLELSVEEAVGAFKAVPKIHRRCRRSTTSASTTCGSANPPPRSPAARRSG